MKIAHFNNPIFLTRSNCLPWYKLCKWYFEDALTRGSPALSKLSALRQWPPGPRHAQFPGITHLNLHLTNTWHMHLGDRIDFCEGFWEQPQFRAIPGTPSENITYGKESNDNDSGCRVTGFPPRVWLTCKDVETRTKTRTISLFSNRGRAGTSKGRSQRPS